MIEIQDLYCGYGGKSVLQGISFTAGPGEITTVIGQNGCGKTTLLRAVCNGLPIEKGDVLIDGRTVKSQNEKQIARQIAYLSQGKNIPDISVNRFVLHGRFPWLGYPRKYGETDYEIAENAMKQMEVYEFRDRMLCTLSGGMRQKVYIAMALCQQAPVILMDEPTTYLDIRQQIRFGDTVRQLADSGKTLILVLHDILWALKISDRIVAVNDGKVVQWGTPDEILSGGTIEKIYGVSVKTVSADGGVEYYYANCGGII